jgi:hypothetical protein
VLALLLLLAVAVDQPVPFSHKAHSARGLQCKDCHPNPDPGEHMTLPAASKCQTCHKTMAKSPEPFAWVRIYTVPADVYWNHRSHLQAGMTCQMCHGDVAKMDVTAKATDAAFMVGCIACHREHKANTGCEFCHEGK